MDNKEIADELWEILFNTFDSNAKNKNFRIGGPFQGMTNDVQDRIVPKLAKLKSGESDDETLGSLEADFNVCHAIGWISDESYNKSIKLLRSID